VIAHYFFHHKKVVNFKIESVAIGIRVFGNKSEKELASEPFRSSFLRWTTTPPPYPFAKPLKHRHAG